MVFKCLLSLIAGLVFSLNVFAREPATSASVKKLLEITEVSKTVDTIYAQIDNMSSGIATQMGLTEKDKPAFDEYMKKVNELIREEMTWEKMKEPMIQVYIKKIQGLLCSITTDKSKVCLEKNLFYF